MSARIEHRIATQFQAAWLSVPSSTGGLPQGQRNVTQVLLTFGVAATCCLRLARASFAAMEPFKTFLSFAVAERIAAQLQQHLSAAGATQFLAPLADTLDALEMKARAQAMATSLAQVLPSDPADRATVLEAMLHPDCTGPGESDAQGLRGWAVWPLTMVVATHGQDDFDRSMALLRAMTMRFTSEFDVRAFLIADQPRTLATLSSWLDDPNEHVRRWISEGTRPRLPWGERLTALVADPVPMLPLLERLRDDPSDYVRRSVANHLNDIAKDHPELVITLCRDWMNGADRNRKGLIKHGLRSLVKAGNPAALAILGLNPPQLEADAPLVTPASVRLGESLQVACTLRSTSDTAQDLVIDLVLWFRKADGRLRPKVFKGTRCNLAAGETLVFRREMRLRAVTTRQHYAGQQAIALRINGQDTPQTEFDLQL